MDAENKQRGKDKVRFPIGAKLILIICFIVIVSLGGVTVFVYFQIHNEIRVNSEATNAEINRLSAADIDAALASINSNTKTFVQITAAMEGQRTVIREAIDIFFNENSQIAAVYHIPPQGEARVFVNSRYFSLRGIDEPLAVSFFESRRFVLEQAGRGQTLLLNAASYFSRPLLAMAFPLSDNGAAGVLFASDKISGNLSYEMNKSFMINSSADILAYSDFSIIRDRINAADIDFISDIINSRDVRGQMLVKSDFGIFNTASDFQPSAYIWINDIIARVTGKIQPVLNRVIQFLFNSGSDKETQADDNLSRQLIAFTKLNSANAVVITGIEYEKVFGGFYTIMKIVICISAAALVFSIIITAVFSGSITRPLRKLSAAVRRIEEGDFLHEAEIKNSDETGVLASGFAGMSAALNNFGKFTNKDIVLKSMRGEISPGGVPKHCTVFFSDIHDFAAKTENFSRIFGNEGSEKIVKWLNHYYSEMIGCIEKTNGVTDKLIGDSLMAHWGTAFTAGSPRNDAFACVKAALMMRKVLFFMNRARSKGDNADPVIRIGCGISSGIVTAGQIGSENHMEYTVIGDTVNLAAQIGSFAGTLGADILISEDTYNLAGEKFKTLEMPPVTVKGREKPVKVFAIINFLREPKGPQNIDELRNLLGINMF